MKTTYCKIKDENHPAFGGRYAVLVKTAWSKHYWTCFGENGPWFSTAKEARTAAEQDADGMTYEMPDGTSKTVTPALA